MKGNRPIIEAPMLNIRLTRQRKGGPLRGGPVLGKIEEALEHIENGSFGSCGKCGEDIGVERLRIRPVTTYCIACKEEQEAGESRN